MFGRPTKKERAELEARKQEGADIRRRIINDRAQYLLANSNEPTLLTIDWDTWHKMGWSDSLFLGMKVNQVFSPTELIEVS